MSAYSFGRSASWGFIRAADWQRTTGGTPPTPQPTTTVLKADKATAPVGTPILLTATVAMVTAHSPGPTGTVTFKEGTVELGTSAVDAGTLTAGLSVSLSQNLHHIVAHYNGDDNWQPSTSGPVSIQFTAAAKLWYGVSLRLQEGVAGHWLDGVVVSEGSRWATYYCITQGGDMTLRKVPGTETLIGSATAMPVTVAANIESFATGAGTFTFATCFDDVVTVWDLHPDKWGVVGTIGLGGIDYSSILGEPQAVMTNLWAWGPVPAPVGTGSDGPIDQDGTRIDTDGSPIDH